MSQALSGIRIIDMAIVLGETLRGAFMLPSMRCLRPALRPRGRRGAARGSLYAAGIHGNRSRIDQ